MPFIVLFTECFPALTRARAWAECRGYIGHQDRHIAYCDSCHPENDQVLLGAQREALCSLGEIREGFLEVAWLKSAR